MTLVVFLAALIGGMLIGLPICFSLLFSGVSMMLFLDGFNSQILSQNLFSGADSFSMMAVPFFIMAGEFMNRGGITKRIVNAANALVGHVRGGLGYVSILAILVFASMVGSAVASTAFLGAILIPMMVRAGYKRDTCTGLIAAGNILSPIMPPSVPMIIFGVQAGVSVTKLFMGGIAPAVYLSASLCVLWFFVANFDDRYGTSDTSGRYCAECGLQCWKDKYGTYCKSSMAIPSGGSCYSSADGVIPTDCNCSNAVLHGKLILFVW